MNSIRRLSFIAIALSSASLIAQRQVNTRVDNSLYGAGSIPIGSVKCTPASTSMPMQSEIRNEYYRSGAIPSDIKMNRAAQGPLTPNGPMDYIPKPQPAQGAYVPPPMTMPAYNTGSIQRPMMPSSPNQTMIAPKQFNSAIAPTKFH
jgi:hypothetical protein